jgi:adenosine deaminase
MAPRRLPTDTLGNVPPAAAGSVVTPRHQEFFLRVPKTELHCHLLGTVRHETFSSLVRKHQAPLSREDVDGFYRREGKPTGVLRVLRALERHVLLEPDDFRRITYEYLQDAARESVRHAEFFWNPTASLRDVGLSYGQMQAGILRGMADAETDFDIGSLLVPAIDREASAAEATEMVRLMTANRHEAVAGIGIDYRETDRPPELFREAFRLAKANGLRATAHAGEFGTPWTNVATVVDDLQVDRVDHGYTVINNPDLVKRCVDKGIVFTVVPTNSYYLRTLEAERWAVDHPLRPMIEQGLRVHPNTDDPTLHHITPAGSWELMYSHFGCTAAELRVMLLNGIDGSWVAEDRKRTWRTQWTAEFDALAAAAF